jgi:hypothetical protein
MPGGETHYNPFPLIPAPYTHLNTHELSERLKALERKVELIAALAALAATKG